MNTYLTFRTIFFAGLLALALGPLIARLAARAGLMDWPNSAPHKQHGVATPLAGGTVFFICLLIVGWVEHSFMYPPLGNIVLASTVVYFFGLLDDYRHLSPSWKLLGQFLAAVLLIYLGVYVQLFAQNWINNLITIFWVVGVTNAYNFVDSKDGLAIGLAGLASAFFMLVTIESKQMDISQFSTILVGICLGIFYFNAAPARFFLGDSGSQVIGFILAALGIAYNPLGYSRLDSWYIPILLVGVPIFDATLVIFSRLRRGAPLYKGAFDHTYHRLVALGMHPNRAILSMHLAAILLGCLAFIALGLQTWFSNLLFGLVVLLGIGLILALDMRFKVAQ